MSLQESPAALRRRLMNPPNAVRDEGIDLRRHLKIVPRAPVIVIPQAPEPILKVGRHNRGWPIQYADPIEWHREPRIANIIRFVAKCHEVAVADILADRRTANLIRPRHIAMWLAKRMTTKSLPYIGQRFGGRDHTTVLSAVRKIERNRQIDPDLQLQLDQFQSALRSNPVENGNADENTPAA